MAPATPRLASLSAAAFIAALAAGCIPIRGTTAAALRGRLLDDGRPVPGATVTYHRPRGGGTASAVTDSTAYFALPGKHGLVWAGPGDCSFRWQLDLQREARTRSVHVTTFGFCQEPDQILLTCDLASPDAACRVTGPDPYFAPEDGPLPKED